LHELLNDALDLAATRLRGPSGFDGKWRWVSSRNQQPVEVYFSIEEPDRVYFHIDCNSMPVKFCQISNLKQLTALLDFVLNECR
jgi:hypothetical protein